MAGHSPIHGQTTEIAIISFTWEPSSPILCVINKKMLGPNLAVDFVLKMGVVIVVKRPRRGLASTAADMGAPYFKGPLSKTGQTVDKVKLKWSQSVDISALYPYFTLIYPLTSLYPQFSPLIHSLSSVYLGLSAGYLHFIQDHLSHPSISRD